VIGVLFSVGVSQLVMLLVPSLPASIPAWAVTSGLVVSVSVGLIFGVWPAMKASRLDPIQCLRYELGRPHAARGRAAPSEGRPASTRFPVNISRGVGVLETEPGHAFVSIH
jgi:hypothetical protein